MAENKTAAEKAGGRKMDHYFKKDKEQNLLLYLTAETVSGSDLSTWGRRKGSKVKISNWIPLAASF